LNLIFTCCSFFYVVEARRAIPCKLQNFELTRLKLITLVRRCGGLLLFDRRLCGRRRRGFFRAFVLGGGCRCTGHKGTDQHKKEKKADQDIFLFHQRLLLSVNLLVKWLARLRIGMSFVLVVSKNQHSFQLNQYSLPLDVILVIELSAPL